MRAGIVVGLTQPRIGFAITDVTSIAVSVPSLRAPMRYVCCVDARCPVAMASLWRSLKTRTARPAAARER